jgi:hypothetical protein
MLLSFFVAQAVRSTEQLSALPAPEEALDPQNRVICQSHVSKTLTRKRNVRFLQLHNFEFLCHMMPHVSVLDTSI